MEALLKHITVWLGKHFENNKLANFNGTRDQAGILIKALITDRNIRTLKYYADMSGSGDSGYMEEQYIQIDSEKFEISGGEFDYEAENIASWDWYNNEGGRVELHFDFVSGNLDVKGGYNEVKLVDQGYQENLFS